VFLFLILIFFSVFYVFLNFWFVNSLTNLLDNGTRWVLFSYENDKMSTLLAVDGDVDVDDMIMPQINKYTMNGFGK